MRITCPHCQNSIEDDGDNPSTEFLCPACGRGFQLVPSPTLPWDSKAGPGKLGRFDILQSVGSGGFGAVYKARDPQLDRVVAIKVPHPGVGSRGHLDRLLREARSAAQLRHPAIVPVYEVGQAGGVPFLVSEFVQGVSLEDLLTARRPSPHEAADWLAAVADALQYAHERGVVHRDVKPSNIMLETGIRSTESGVRPDALTPDSCSLTPRLMDFGLAKRDAGEVTMTLAGQVLGTPAYMSPEQARGEAHEVDGRGDVYSLGVVLYQLLTGELPFRGNARMMLHQVLTEEPPAPRRLNDRVPRDLGAVCQKAMSKEPAQRYQTAREMADDLRRYLAGQPVQARGRSRLTGIGRWLRRPERVRDAGVVLLAVAAIRAAIALFALTTVLVLLGRRGLHGESVVGLVLTTGLCAVQFWLGVRVLQHNLVALWGSLVVTLAYLGTRLVVIGKGLGPEASPFLANPLEHFTVPVMHALIYTVQLGACVPALLAYYANRNVMRWRQGDGRLPEGTSTRPTKTLIAPASDGGRPGEGQSTTAE